nr:hypothetical protein CFP56_16866 [Quercus suber]
MLPIACKGAWEGGKVERTYVASPARGCDSYLTSTLSNLKFNNDRGKSQQHRSGGLLLPHHRSSCARDTVICLCSAHQPFPSDMMDMLACITVRSSCQTARAQQDWNDKVTFSHRYVSIVIGTLMTAQLPRRVLNGSQVLGSFVVLYTCANASVKLSILFYYRRIFSSGRIFNICSWCLIAASVVWFVYGLLAWILYCGTHVRENFEGPFDVCPMWGVDMEMAVFVADSVIDFFILVMPVPMVCGCSISPVRSDVWVLKAVADPQARCGDYSSASAGKYWRVARLRSRYEAWYESDSWSSANIDASIGGDLILSVWPAIEVGVGLIACCLPSISMTFLRMVSAMLLQGWRSISDTFSRSQASRNTSFTHLEAAPGSSTHQGSTSDERTDSAGFSATEIHLTHLPKSKAKGYNAAHVAPSTQHTTGWYTLGPESKPRATKAEDSALV